MELVELEKANNPDSLVSKGEWALWGRERALASILGIEGLPGWGRGACGDSGGGFGGLRDG